MASTGTALFPSSSTFPNTTVFPGQGTLPIERCRISTDDVSVSTPTWIDLSAKLRSYLTSLGRNSELDEFDAATCTAVFDNRDRSLDPVINSAIRPMNRIWLYEEFSGEVRDLFRGYAESWAQNWDRSGIVDATATVTAVDESKVLTLAALPVTNPPRNSYNDLIQFDNPAGYWRWQDVNLKRSVSIDADTGEYTDDVGVTDWLSTSGFAIVHETPIVGSFAETGGILRMSASAAITALSADAGDAHGGNFFTLEFWFRCSGLPGSTLTFMSGPASASFPGNAIWTAQLLTTGIIRWNYLDGTGTNKAVDTVTAVVANTWYHVGFELDNATMRAFLNGVQDNTAAAGTQFASSLTTPNMSINGITGVTSLDLAELAVYPGVALAAARLAAHYTAGSSRGYVSQLPGVRVGAVLDTIGSTAPRNIYAGTRPVQAVPQSGQPAIDALRQARAAENGDAALFITAGGGVTFLDAGHRSSSPYNTVQATFDDDGTDLPYLDATLDFSETFLFNEWNVTRAGGTVQTSSDATSQSRYFKRSQSISDIPVTTDGDASAIATAMLAKYKDPFTRVTTIKPKMADPETARVVFALELMDRIEFFRTPPGGGTRIDQVLFIQKIDVSGTPGVPPSVTLGVSPL